MADQVIARLRAHGPRRIASIVSTAILGLLVLALASVDTMPFGWRALLVGIGVCGLLGAWSIFKATQADLILTRESLTDAEGRVLARMENIEAVERGLFAFKPSNGFSIRLKTKMAGAWAPGVWWRFGKRIGIGGAVSAQDAKGMAVVLELALADRDGTLPRS
ncbi:MAG: hypothetical protein AAGO57_01010 [Pseudomonadota bacterium]